MADVPNPLNWFTDVTQLYKAPVVGGLVEDPNQAEKQRTMAAAALYFQRMRPEMIQTQQNMLNNRLAQYQGAADVMASMGLPTSGAQYSGVSPFGPNAFGAFPQGFDQARKAWEAMPPEQRAYDATMAERNKREPGWFGSSRVDTTGGRAPPSRDAAGNQAGYNDAGQWTTWSQYTGNPIAPVAGQQTYRGTLRNY